MRSDLQGEVARLHSALSLQTSENEMLRAVPPPSLCKATAVILHGVVSQECRMTEVTLHSHVRCKEI